MVRQEAREELAVDQQGVAGEGPGAALVGDRLEGLVDARLCQLVVHGPGPAQAVARVPDHVVDRLAGCLRRDEGVDYRLATVRAAGTSDQQVTTPGTSSDRATLSTPLVQRTSRAWTTKCSS